MINKVFSFLEVERGVNRILFNTVEKRLPRKPLLWSLNTVLKYIDLKKKYFMGKNEKEIYS
jgi:hypothetical protein